MVAGSRDGVYRDLLFGGGGCVDSYPDRGGGGAIINGDGR